jgi:hypothetical protein
MRAHDRYTKIIESLVNGDSVSAEDLLHEAFVEKAREIWSDLVEQDEIVEDDIAEEELDEAFGDEESDDFLNDIETSDDEIEAEEAFGEAEDEDGGELDADLELAADDGFDTDETETEDGDDRIENAMMSVEDALSDLKAEFAKLMGDDMNDDMDSDEEGDEEGADFEVGMDDEMSDDSEVEEEFTFEAEEDLEEDAEELDESAELHKVGADKKIHPVAMPAGDDGKSSPVKGKPAMGGSLLNTGHAKEAGRPAPKVQTMSGFKHPGEGASLNTMSKGHGAEKKGQAPAKPGTDSMINKAPR